MMNYPMTRLPQAYLSAREAMDRKILGYIETGVYLQEDGYDEKKEKWVGRSVDKSAQLRTLVRQCARELKRPFVLAEARGKGDHVSLDIPKQKRTEALRTPLNLVAVPGARWGRRDDTPVTVWHGKTVVTYHFQKKGTNVFAGWLQNCKTNPEFRKALGLPTRGGK